MQRMSMFSVHIYRGPLKDYTVFGYCLESKISSLELNPVKNLSSVSLQLTP